MSQQPLVSQPLGVALVGSKFMGRAHANAWGQVNRFFELPRRVHLRTAAARDGDALDKFVAQWSIHHGTTDWRSIAKDPMIELVDVATPNDSHREIALEMLEAGKHVACEKPLAGTLNDARAMRDAAKKHRKKLSTFVWFNYRRCPAVALAWQMMRQGLVGRVYHVRAQYLQSWGGPETPLLWRFKKGEAGSGAHGDLNAHIVDMARFLLGEEVQDIHGAVSRTFVQERVIPGTQKKGRSDVDDAVVFLASFQSGAIATFEATRLASGHLNANRIEINGELGALRFDFESMNELWYCDNREDVRTRGWKRIVATSTAGKHPYAANWWPDAHVVGYEHGFTNMAADVIASLCGQEPLVPLPDFEDAYQTQRVLEAALVSAKEKASIRMAEVK